MLIDVVVPIYNAYEALENCLTSLEKHQQGINNVLLINDASCDLRISALINDFALRNHWDVIESFINRGFVQTANLGLKESSNHTLLLNSDTIVTKNWIPAFKKAIESSEEIGTITCWSNNAEICSFPEFLKNNSIASNLNQLADTLFNGWKPRYPELPTAVGFCMLISKKAKLNVGYFNETQFGHGYGEENDFSLRVAKAGLKNILCDNAYVAHIGNESFVDLGKKPDGESMQRLLEEHPEYLKMIGDYIVKDPLAAIRDGILKMLQQHKIKLN